MTGLEPLSEVAAASPYQGFTRTLLTRVKKLGTIDPITMLGDLAR